MNMRPRGSGGSRRIGTGSLPVAAGSVLELTPEPYECLAYGAQAAGVGHVYLEQDGDLFLGLDLPGSTRAAYPARVSGGSLRLPTIGDRKRPSSSSIPLAPSRLAAGK